MSPCRCCAFASAAARAGNAPAAAASSSSRWSFPALALELALEGVPVVLDRGLRREQTDRSPQVVFYASGEATPGSLDFRRADSGEFLWQLRWDLLGRIEVTDDPLEAGDG